MLWFDTVFDKKNDRNVDASDQRAWDRSSTQNLSSPLREGTRVNRDRRSLCTMKLIQNNSLASQVMKNKEVEESRNTKASVSASLTQANEELASMVISAAES